MHNCYAVVHSLNQHFLKGVPLSTGSDCGNHQDNSLAVYENRPRIPSHHVRQLTRGKFIIKSKDIALLECIGEGNNYLFNHHFATWSLPIQGSLVLCTKLD